MLVQNDTAINPQVNSATSGGAAAIAPALPATAGKVNFLEGFDITGGGATAASVIEANITGLAGGTIYFELPILAGVTGPAFSTGTQGNTFSIRFPEPLPASGVNIAITLNVPSFGAGNTKSSAILYGFQK